MSRTAEEGVSLGGRFVVDGSWGGLGLGVAGEERHGGGRLCVVVDGRVGLQSG